MAGGEVNIKIKADVLIQHPMMLKKPIKNF
jgi:hypothetical protein